MSKFTAIFTMLALVFLLAGSSANTPFTLNKQGLLLTPPACQANNQTIDYTPVTTMMIWMYSNDVAQAFKDIWGVGQVWFDKYRISRTPPEFQIFIFSHECAHHMLGHVDMPIIQAFANGKKREFENEADCMAMRRLKNEFGFKPRHFQKVYDTTRRIRSDSAFYPPDVIKRQQETIQRRIDHLKSCL
jgi:hypothetical protein